jgi:hypothetical protein
LGGPSPATPDTAADWTTPQDLDTALFNGFLAASVNKVLQLGIESV